MSNKVSLHWYPSTRLLILGLPLMLSLTIGLHAAAKPPVTRGAPQISGMPDPTTLQNEREVTEYLTALEHQNEVLATKLGELEHSASALRADLHDRETKLVRLSQALGEKEQLVTTILANEDALSEALAMRDERVALLEDTLQNLKARAKKAVAMESEHQQLAHAYHDLQAKIEPTERELASERRARSELATAYAELRTQREQLDAALGDANAALVELDTRLANLSGTRRQEQASYQELHNQLAEEKSARQQAMTRLATEEERLATLSNRFQELDNRYQEQQAALEQAELHLESWKSQERVHKELIEAFATLKKNHEELKEQLITRHIECQDLQEALSAAQNQSAQYAAQHEEQQTAHHELVAAYQALSSRFYEQEALAAMTLEQIETLRNALAEAEQYTARIDTERDKEAAIHTELVDAYQTLSARFAQQEEMLTTTQRQAETLAAQRQEELAQWEEQDKSYRELVDAYRDVSARCCEQSGTLAELRSSLDHANTALAVVQEELADRTEDLRAHRNEQATLAQNCQELQRTNHGLEQQIEELVQLSRERDQSVLSARNESAELREQLKELSHSWEELDQERQTLAAQLAHFEGVETGLHKLEADLQRRKETIAQLTATNQDQQTALHSLERTRDSLAKELSDLKAFQGALLQWEVEKLATARTSSAPQIREVLERGRPATTRIHIVSPGETLSTIAQEYNKTVQDLYNANCDSIPNQNQVRIGTALVIP